MLRTLRSLSTIAIRSSRFKSNIIKLNSPTITKLVNTNSFHSTPCNWQRKHIRRASYKDVLKIAEDCHSPAYLIDVRSPKTVKKLGAIPFSINIPLADLQKAFQCMTEEEFLRKYRKAKPLYRSEIIFYCMSGELSIQAQNLLTALGYRYAANYVGGWKEWTQLQKTHHK